MIIKESECNTSELCENLKKINLIEPSYYEKYNVKRGLRNPDGTGVVAGITNICNVHGYVIDEGEKEPIAGELIYRGYNVRDLVLNAQKEKRFGFEEIVFLLLTGDLPTKTQLERFTNVLAENRELPDQFFEDMILKAASPNVMNKLASCVLALYSYDDDPDHKSTEKEMQVAVSLISKLPSVMVYSYQVMQRYYNKKSMIMHQVRKNESTAQAILSALRPDRQYTEEEAHLLDLCLMLHAEHGGGNNSTFACRVLTSSGTDPYSAYAAAIGALKGPKHGGANIKVMEMLDYIEKGVKNWENEDEVSDFLRKLINKEAGDRSGLIYGMGHAVYTLSDPRAVLLKEFAFDVAKGTEFEKQFNLLQSVEKLTPQIFAEKKGDAKAICANVDMYSGLVYKMLGIPSELFTSLFAVSRMAGWCAHRFEEIATGNRIIRPAYKAIAKPREYMPIDSRKD